MHRPFLVPIAWLVLVSTTRSEAADEKSELEGTWVQVSSERAGRKLAPKKDRKLTISGDRFVIRDGEEIFVAGTWKLDPTKNPKTYDGTYTEGPNKGMSFKGIYKIEGDQVTMCGNKERPTEYKTSAEQGGLLAVYRRAKP